MVYSGLEKQDLSQQALEKQDRLLTAVNKTAELLLDFGQEDFGSTVIKCLAILGECVEVDRVYIWENHTRNGKLYTTQVYEWSENAEPQQGNELTVDISFDEAIPTWEKTMRKGNCINNIVRNMVQEEQDQLSPQGIISILVVPIYIKDYFWGFIGFDDCRKERQFLRFEEEILKSAGLMIATALEHEHINKKLEEARQEAIASARAKSNFLSNMSHRLKTPLNAIIGMSHLLSSSMLDEVQSKYLKKIFDASQSLLNIIDDILEYTDMDSQKFEIVSREYYLSELVSDTVSSIKPQAAEKGIKLITNIDSSMPSRYSGDLLRIKRILEHLLSNALKNTVEGHIALIVEEESSDGEISSLSFTVEDTGTGIRPERLKALLTAASPLDMLMRETRAGSLPGLVVNQCYAAAMSGKITAESEYGKGSRFTFKIPQRIIDSVSVGNMAPLTEKTAPGSFKTMGARALIVDDNEINLLVAEEILRYYGIEVETAPSGASAIELVKRRAYDLIFMDYMMPGMDGIETAKHIRDVGGEYCNVPIIALTANALSGNRDMFLQSSMDSLLSKPIDIGALDRVLLRFLPEDKIIPNTPDTLEPVEESASLSDLLERIFRECSIDVPGVLKLIGGSEDVYLAILKTFCRDESGRLDSLADMARKRLWGEFQLEAHNQKSSLSDIGAKELSGYAKELELAAGDKDYGYINANLGEYIAAAHMLHDRLEEILPGNLDPIRPIKKEAFYDAASRILLFLDEREYGLAIKELNEVMKLYNGVVQNVEIKKIKLAIESGDYENAGLLLKTEMSKSI